MIESYVCRNYQSKANCTTCEGCGRNSDDKIETKSCYFAEKGFEIKVTRENLIENFRNRNRLLGDKDEK